MLSSIRSMYLCPLCSWPSNEEMIGNGIIALPAREHANHFQFSPAEIGLRYAIICNGTAREYKNTPDLVRSPICQVFNHLAKVTFRLKILKEQ